jgi:hypothetical protein
MNNSNNSNEKAELLFEFIQNDPYIAFLIWFLHDFGLEPILHKFIINNKTQTKISATNTRKLLIIQNSKKLEIPVAYARRVIEEKYGKLPIEYF